MSGGYAGKVLWVDLSSGEVLARQLDEALARRFIGGAGLAAKVIWDETDASTDPFSENNPLVFMTGPVTGTRVPTSGRFVVSSLSPLTNIWGQAHAGGHWGYTLKMAGWDGIVVKGIAKRPVYLLVDGDTVELRDGVHLWGKDNWATDETLKAELGEKVCSATIGQAGERLVRFASILCAGKEGGVAATNGLGAIMGSKKLKAIAVRGSMRPEIYDEASLKSSVAAKFISGRIDFNELRRKWEPLLHKMWQDGKQGIKNYKAGEFEGFLEVYIENMFAGRNVPCMGCSVGCRDSNLIGDRKRPAGAATVCLGARCMIKDMAVLTEAYDMCNRYGMDSMSVGGVIAFSMELYEKGTITKGDTVGIDLTWGNGDGLLAMVQQIGEREGFGRLLGEGVRRAADRIGGLASEYAMHVKGQEMPPHDLRSWNAGALEFATASGGARHMEGSTVILSSVPFLAGELGTDRFAVQGVGKLVAKAQDFAGLFDSMVVCKKLLGVTNTKQMIPPELLLEWLNFVTGWDMGIEEFMKAGERAFNFKRMISVRRGISRKDDTIPLRFLTAKRNPEDNLPPLGAMLNEYYACRGWSEEGIPSREKLTYLGLQETGQYGA